MADGYGKVKVAHKCSLVTVVVFDGTAETLVLGCGWVGGWMGY